jgi:hypothetical protein
MIGTKLVDKLFEIRTKMACVISEANYQLRHAGSEFQLLDAYATDLEIDMTHIAGYLSEDDNRPLYWMLRECGTQLDESLFGNSSISYYTGQKGYRYQIYKVDLASITFELIADTTITNQAANMLPSDILESRGISHVVS